MVNVQNSSEFSCQVLNRDVWSNSAVKTIINEHFIFWQVYHDSEDGLRYMTFYPVNNWPYVAVIDPRTGEKLVEWHKIDAVSFCDLITEFLTAQPTMDDSFGVSKTPPRKKMKTNESIIEADENAQLEAAIKASLESTINKAKKNTSRISGESSSDEDEESLETFGSDEETLGPVNRKNERGTPPVELDDAMQVCSSAKETVVEECPHVQVVSEIKVIPSENSSVHNSSGVIPLVPYKKRRHVSKLNEEDESNDGESDSSSEMVNEKDKWKLHLGKETDPLSKLILRLPDGTREVLEMPKSSKLMALVLYLSGKGFTNESYEIVTNFPRRKLSYMNFDSTLESIGLFPQETVFVQKRKCSPGTLQSSNINSPVLDGRPSEN
ncbi:UBX domain-containing protein 2 [Armadillidium vulgare]|nr:UBX domain-containing protein 2 [Armadillidium vulgare]